MESAVAMTALFVCPFMFYAPGNLLMQKCKFAKMQKHSIYSRVEQFDFMIQTKHFC